MIIRSILVVSILSMVVACDRAGGDDDGDDANVALPGAAAGVAAAAAEEKIVEVRRVPIGEIALPSGKVIACDGIVLDEGTPFTTAVPPGKHPVELTVAKFSNGDERIAAATIRFAKAEPAKWEMALLPGQDASKLTGDKFFGYGVDSGTGCFMDPLAHAAMEAKIKKDENFFQAIIAAMGKNKHTTWEWGIVPADEKSGAELVVFSSGVGDGGYASYFGRGADGNVACLVTDFDLLDEKDRPWAAKASSTKPSAR